MSVVTFTLILFIFSLKYLDAIDYPDGTHHGELTVGSNAPSFRGAQLKAIGGGVVAGILSGVAAHFIIADISGSERKIRIKNELTNSIWIRCLDANVNVGGFTVQPGEMYAFDFEPHWGHSIIDRTLYWCWIEFYYHSGVKIEACGGEAPKKSNNFAVRPDGVYLQVAAYNWKLHKRYP